MYTDFIRGGQVVSHKFRMALQIIKIGARCLAIIIILSFGYGFYNSFTPEEIKLLPTLAKFYLLGPFQGEKEVKYYYRGWKTIKLKYLDPKTSFIMKRVERSFEQAIENGIWWAGFSCGGGIILIVVFFWYRGGSLKKANKVRGNFVIKGKALKSILKKHNKKFKKLLEFTLAGLPYPASGYKGKDYTPGEAMHSFLVGSTGSGKTRIIQELLRQVRNEGQRAIIIDVKGDYISNFYEKDKDIILNPLDKRGSNWSFFEEADPLRGFDTIASTLIPHTRGDPFWNNASRVLFSEMAKAYIGSNLSPASFVDKILCSDLKSMTKLLKDSPAHHLVSGDSDKTVACILMNLVTYLAPLKVYRNNKDLFSIKKWVSSNKGRFLFLSTNASMQGSLLPLIQMQMGIAINAVCSKDKAKIPIWFFIDEVPFFEQPIAKLEVGLRLSRSFGGRFVLGTQDLASLSKIYGDKGAEILANNCNNKVFLRTTDPQTQSWCSRVLGEGEIEEFKESISYGAHEMRDGISTNHQLRFKKVATPAEFGNLVVGEGYFKMGNFPPAKHRHKEVSFLVKAEGFIENKELSQEFQEEIVKLEKIRKSLEAKGGSSLEKTLVKERVKEKIKEKTLEKDVTIGGGF